MFRVEEFPYEVKLGEVGKYVIDHDRNVWLRRVSGLGLREEDPSGSSFKLVWEHRVIPFDASGQSQLDEQTNTKFRLVEFETFGSSLQARLEAGIEAFIFESENERRAARLLAAEALLIFGFLYDGDQYPDGQYRVRVHEGDMSTDCRLRSFGYTSAS